MGKRPLLSIDIEATGTKPATDRIIQIGVVFVDRDGTDVDLLINPGCPIPPESTEIHGITDEMVANEPAFEHYASTLHHILKDADLLGFNLTGFDVPILWEEFYRCGITWDLSETNVIDAGVLFKKREPRTLAAATRFYCGREIDNAHNALADARATVDVWRGMLAKYPDLFKMSVPEQAVASQYEERRLDLEGKIIVGKDGRPAYNFGKDKGTAVEDNPGFGRWMLDKDFSENTKHVVRSILYPPVEVATADDGVPF